MNDARFGSPALAAFLAREHDILYGMTRKECVTPDAPRRSMEVQAADRAADAKWFKSMGLAKTAEPEKTAAPVQEPAAAPKFKAGDMALRVGAQRVTVTAVTPNYDYFGTLIEKVDFRYEDGRTGFERATDLELIPTTPAESGWVQWHGGECPVERNVMVEYRMRFGNGYSCAAAGRLHWDHGGGSGDIVSYRVKP